jgi:hypothetical protein
MLKNLSCKFIYFLVANYGKGSGWLHRTIRERKRARRRAKNPSLSVSFSASVLE